MCGIIVMFKKDLDWAEDLWMRLEHRGTDSFGYYGRTREGRFIWDKWIYNPEIKSLPMEWVILHNRWASVGGKSNYDIAHPIVRKKTYLIHNGTKRELYYSIRPAKSDTDAISIIYHQLRNKEDIFQYLDDVGVIFLYDKKNKRIIFHRDKSRPLYINPDFKIIASEPIIAGRWRMIEPQEMIIPEEDFNLEYLLDNLILNKKEIKMTIKADFGVCSSCFQEKIIEPSIENGTICPHCYYTEEYKKKKYEKGNKIEIYDDLHSDIYKSYI